MDAQLLQTAFKMTVALAAVLLTFGGAVLIAKRFSGTSRGFLKRSAKGATKPLEILAHQNLGPGRALYLVRCLDKKVLVGATNSNIHHLADLHDEDASQEQEQFSSALREELNSETHNTQSFKGNLRDVARI